MNIVFWVLIILALILLWFLLAFAFKPVGNLFQMLYKDAKKQILDNNKEFEL